MKILYYEIVEDCIEAKNVYDAFLNDNINNPFIDYLGKLGKLSNFQDFDIPYFRIIVRGKYTIKGVLNTDHFRLLFPDDAGTQNLDLLKNYVSLFE